MRTIIIKSILSIFMLLISGTTIGQKVLTYSGGYEDGDATYQYYIDDDGGRVMHGSFQYDQNSSVSITPRLIRRHLIHKSGSYINGMKDGSWESEIIVYSKTNTMYSWNEEVLESKRTLSENFKEDKRNGAFSDTYKSEKELFIIKGAYSNGLRHGQFVSTKNIRANALFKPSTSKLVTNFKNGYLDGLFSVEYDRDYQQDHYSDAKRLRCSLSGTFIEGYYTGEWTGLFVKQIAYGEFKPVSISANYDDGKFINLTETNPETGEFKLFDAQYYYNISKEELLNFNIEIKYTKDASVYAEFGDINTRLHELLEFEWDNNNDNPNYSKEKAFPIIQGMTFVNTPVLISPIKQLDSLIRLTKVNTNEIALISYDLLYKNQYREEQKDFIGFSKKKIQNLKNEINKSVYLPYGLTENSLTLRIDKVRKVTSKSKVIQENAYSSEYFFDYGKNGDNYLIPYLVFSGQIFDAQFQNEFTEVAKKYKDKKSSKDIFLNENIVFSAWNQSGFGTDVSTYSKARIAYLNNVQKSTQNIINRQKSFSEDYVTNFKSVQKEYQSIRSEYLRIGKTSDILIISTKLYLLLSKSELSIVQPESEGFKKIDAFLNSLSKPKKELKDILDLKQFMVDFENLDKFEDIHMLNEKYLHLLQ